MTIRVKHFRSPESNRLIATVATSLNDDGTIYYGLAKVNPKDSPNRKMGITIASGRLQSVMNGRSMPVHFAGRMNYELFRTQIKEQTFLASLGL